MTKDQKPKSNLVPFPGAAMDPNAARRAASTIQTLGAELPPDAVTVLAREVISRLAGRVDLGFEHPQSVPLADALTAKDETRAARLVLRRLSDGHRIEDIYLNELAGAARLLGQRWRDDALTSAQVTVAAARIYTLMRGLSASFAPDTVPDGRHAVFASVPGEQHTLGVTMAADLFRRDGWLIDLKIGCSHDELIAELSQTDFALLGLSAATRDVLPALVRLTAAIRISHPYARIVVAGRLAGLEPRLNRLTDADGTSNNFDSLRTIMTGLHREIAMHDGPAHASPRLT